MEQQLLKHIEAAQSAAMKLLESGANVEAVVRDLRSARDRVASRISLLKDEAQRKSEANAQPSPAK